jgi:hypothetical protein
MPKSPVTTTKKTSSTTKKSGFGAVKKSDSATSKAAQKARLVKKLAEQAEALEAPQKLVKKADSKIPLGVRIFFGCCLLIFCIAVYKAILLPKIIQNSQNTPTITNLSGEEGTNEINGNSAILTSTDENDLILTETTVGPAFIKQFYQVFSQKDLENLTTLFDAPLQKSADIRRFFSAYKITPFIDNIENNKISPENIELLSTSPTGTEEYRYTLNYHLVPNNQDFAETRVAKVKYTDK